MWFCSVAPAQACGVEWVKSKWLPLQQALCHLGLDHLGAIWAALQTKNKIHYCDGPPNRDASGTCCTGVDCSLWVPLKCSPASPANIVYLGIGLQYVPRPWLAGNVQGSQTHAHFADDAPKRQAAQGGKSMKGRQRKPDM